MGVWKGNVDVWMGAWVSVELMLIHLGGETLDGWMGGRGERVEVGMS